MKQVVAVALALAVPAGALNAPLVHAHPDDRRNGHHDGRAVHTHWGGHTHPFHATNAPAVAADGYDRAIFLNVFLGVAVSATSPPAAVHESFDLAPPVEGRAHRGVAVAHGHDPPATGRRPSRAPPARLS